MSLIILCYFLNNENVNEYSGTSACLKCGDVLTVEDLLYGLMLPSGNDAAFALAVIFISFNKLFCKIFFVLRRSFFYLKMRLFVIETKDYFGRILYFEGEETRK